MTLIIVPTGNATTLLAGIVKLPAAYIVLPVSPIASVYIPACVLIGVPKYPTLEAVLEVVAADSEAGKSAETNARKLGVPDDPFGAANTVLAAADPAYPEPINPVDPV
jgi:hypothetical protein